MPAIVVRSGGFGDDELQKAGAIAIYDTPGDLAKALDDTPRLTPLPPPGLRPDPAVRGGRPRPYPEGAPHR